MQTIRILPNDLVNRIAAGEVIERPASVVKELIENSLDAGASEIVVDVTDGGRTLISVSDNGSGMSKDDLEKSVLRHATSKLPTDDLLNINFLGFRGEALPSIASVSEMTVESNGLHLDCQTMKTKPSSYDSGSKVRVKNLFSNVPARLKFLRADRVEMIAIVEMLKHLALSRSDVSFYLNDKYKYKNADPLISRITQIMGSDAKDNLLPIESTDGDIKISGFVSVPTLRRASGIDQYLFINNRFVKDKVLVGALRAAYFDVMHAREFPLCCLYLSIPNNQVDVNVSPAKTEVHFLEPARIRDFIVSTIRNKLAETGNNTVVRDVESIGSLGQNIGAQNASAFDQASYSFFDLNIQNNIIENLELPLGYARGQIGNKYILSENKDGLVIIDQHAAHERIVLETLRKGNIKRQQLLIPQIIKLSPERKIAILEMKQSLEESGLIIESFGENDIAIYETPADFDLDLEKCLSDVSDEVLAHGHSSIVLEKLHLKLATYACHHSVRSGQKLSLEQMNVLLRKIEETERGGQCNHGRPVWKKISFSELDGKFERS